ncbi:MAG: ABC transporter permease subunit [Niameybacter sp.]
MQITKKISESFKKYWQLYLFILPGMLYFIIFHFMPMYGVQIAFKDYRAIDGILGSDWVGLKHFVRFFESPQFWSMLKNTVGLSLYQLIAGFPIPIILALLLNQMKNEKFKKTVQMATYAPHFISIVVLCGMMSVFLSPSTGIINVIIKAMGMDPVFFLGDPEMFPHLYVWSGVWQNAGWGTIIYLAALAGVDPSLYEAARVDGANKFRLIWHIDIPGIMPTAILLLIMDLGKVMNIGFQKAYLLQNPLNMEASEIIPTYVYKVGLQQAQFSYSTAIELFNTTINIILLVIVNKFARRVSETSLW